MAVNGLGERFAMDVQGLQKLKQTAREDSPTALKEASQQFEALFMQMMLKSMREATPQSGLLNNQQTQLYTEMLDQQLSLHLSGRGLGLAEQLTSQLNGTAAAAANKALPSDDLIAGIPRATPQPLYGSVPAPAADWVKPVQTGDSVARPKFVDPIDQQIRTAPIERPLRVDRPEPFDRLERPERTERPQRIERSRGVVEQDRPAHVDEFLAKMEGPARSASKASGVPAELILAQAALETGWGRRQITTANGSDSHNLFGIKAGSHWRGATTDIVTTEYVNGQPQKQVDRFRVYPSYEAAFTDYARLIGDNPRYAKVVDAPSAEHAARALQRAGYATDPAYANKLITLMNGFGDSLASAEPQARLTADRSSF